MSSTLGAKRPNLFIKIPGAPEGLLAIEKAIFAGVPFSMRLLFSPEQYVAAADAYLRGIERRIEAGLRADVGSVASLLVAAGIRPSGARRRVRSGN
jgi:transaldolase